MGSYPVHSGVRETRRRLEDAGFKGLQMEALVEMMVGMEERLATKEDVAHAQGVLKQDIAEVRTELKQDIAEVREDLHQLATTVAKNTTRIEGLERAMEALRQELRDRFESFRQEIAAKMNGLRGEMRTIKWIVGAIFALMVPMVGGIIGIALRLGQA